MLIENNRRRPETTGEADRRKRHEQEVKEAIMNAATEMANDHSMKHWVDGIWALAEELPGGGAIGAPNARRRPAGDASGECWRNRAEELAAEITREGKRIEEDEKQRAIGKWKAWMRDGIEKGGRHAHQFNKSTTVLEARGHGAQGMEG